MKNIPLIILGSARGESDTRRLINMLFQGQEYQLIDLLEYKIAPYSYLHDYPADDDFLKLTEELLLHRMIIFATPVYWYAMSGLMKNFFDRLTDLLRLRKECGRQLRGRQTALVAVGSNEELPPGFTVPFEYSAHYLGMHFLASVYCPQTRLKDEHYVQQQGGLFLQKLNEGNK
jgi:putative NADPH-quinone reductase